MAFSYGRLLAILARRTRDLEAAEDALADAFALTLGTAGLYQARPDWKPGVVALMILTSVIGMCMAVPGWVPLDALILGNLGIALCAGAAAAVNHLVDQRIDERMARTRNRPIARGRVTPVNAALFALALGVAGMAILLIWVNALTAWLTLASLVGYAFIYTLFLKRATPQNIVIGGAAGATAPLIASAALDGTLSIQAWILFAIVFLWTPPHFWAIAIYRKAEYANAGFPMMPNVVGDQPTRWRSLVYTLLTLAATAVPVLLGDLGIVYGVAALGLGGWFLWSVIVSMRTRHPSADRRVFAVSIAYLFLLYLFMMVDLLLPW